MLGRCTSYPNVVKRDALPGVICVTTDFGFRKTRMLMIRSVLQVCTLRSVHMLATIRFVDL